MQQNVISFFARLPSACLFLLYFPGNINKLKSFSNKHLRMTTIDVRMMTTDRNHLSHGG
jgi:hypothetical protein